MSKWTTTLFSLHTSSLFGKQQPPAPQPFNRQLHELLIPLNPYAAAAQVRTSKRRRSAAKKRIQHQRARVCSTTVDTLEQREGLLRGMTPKPLLHRLRRGERPNVLHLAAAVFTAHDRVLEGMPALLCFCGPENRFG